MSGSKYENIMYLCKNCYQILRLTSRSMREKTSSPHFITPTDHQSLPRHRQSLLTTTLSSWLRDISLSPTSLPIVYLFLHTSGLEWGKLQRYPDRLVPSHTKHTEQEDQHHQVISICCASISNFKLLVL